MSLENNEQNTGGIDLRVLLSDFGRVARRIWLLAVVLMLLFSGVFTLKAKLGYRPMYRASATFTVYVADPLQSEVRGYNAATAEQMAKTFPYILTSGALKDMVKRDLNIPAMPPVSASVMNNTNVFTLTVTDREPQRAYDVLQSVMKHYPDVAEFVVGPTVMNLLDESGVPEAPYNTVSFAGTIKKGAVIGFGLWAVAAILLTMMRSAVHNEEELKRILNVRCMGAIPLVKAVQRGKREACPMVEDRSGSMGFAESIQLLRVRVEKEMQQEGKKVLLISSATPGEGKTTVAINLAKSLAMKGKRVLLVDCDLRNPSVAANLSYENKNGLVDFLEGKIGAEKALHKTEIPNLHVTFAGGPVGDAAELLAKKETRLFMDAARDTFDYMILDTPPAALLTDAAEIAGAADAALMVIRQNYAPRSQIMEGARLLADSGAPMIGCVMNYTTGHALNGHGGYYGYGGYSQYYKHYRKTAAHEE